MTEVRGPRLVIAALAALALLAASCGGGGSGDDEAADTGSTSDTQGTAAASETADTAVSSDTGETDGEAETGETGADQEPTASDVGVTADTLTIGYISADSSALPDLPIILDIDEPEYGVTALVDDINERGGINGRQIDLKTFLWDPLDIPASLDAICLEAGQDNELFAAMTNTFFGDAVPCLAGEAGVPMLMAQTIPPGIVERSDGNVFVMEGIHDQLLTDAITILGEEGFLDGKTIGVPIQIEPGQESLPAAIEEAVAPYDATVEFFEIERVLFGTNPTIAAGAQAMSEAGIDLVLTGNNSPTLFGLMTEADLIGWSPSWLVSDLSEQTNLVVPTNAPAAQLENVIGISANVTSGLDDVPVTAMEEECIEFRNSIQGAEPIDERGSSAYTTYLHDACFLVKLMDDVLTASGVNPTRESFREATAAISPFETVAGGQASFAPDKAHAPDEYRIVEYSAVCPGADNGCFTPTSDWIEAPR